MVSDLLSISIDGDQTGKDTPPNLNKGTEKEVSAKIRRRRRFLIFAEFLLTLSKPWGDDLRVRCLMQVIGRTGLEPVFGLAVRFEFLKQPGSPTVQADLDRLEAQAEDVGNLTVGEAFQVAEHERGAVVHGKLVNEIGKALNHLFLHELLLK
jgi:hypothetical protein